MKGLNPPLQPASWPHQDIARGCPREFSIGISFPGIPRQTTPVSQLRSEQSAGEEWGRPASPAGHSSALPAMIRETRRARCKNADAFVTNERTHRSSSQSCAVRSRVALSRIVCRANGSRRTGIATIDRRYAPRFSFPVTFLLNGDGAGSGRPGGSLTSRVGHVDISGERATWRVINGAIRMRSK